MAISKQTEEFLKYAIKNLSKGRNTKISAFDVFPGVPIAKYKTWGELYDDAVKQYIAQGGTKDAVEKLKDPNYKPPTPGAKPAMTAEAAAMDPLGKAMNQAGLTVSTDDNGNAILQANVFDDKGKRTDAVVEHFLYVDTYTDSSGKKISRVNIKDNYDEIAKIAINDYKNNLGGVDNLFESLYKKKLISKETYNSKNISAPDFRKALQYTIRQYGISAFDARQYNQTLTVGTLKSFLNSNALPSGTSGEGSGAKNLPVRDINLVDRDVVKAVIKDVYFGELQKEVDDATINAKTDYYMDQIKSGTLTTVKEGSKEVTRTTTPGFSQARLEAELQPKVKKEFTEDYNQAQSINFLSFLSDLGAR